MTKFLEVSVMLVVLAIAFHICFRYEEKALRRSNEMYMRLLLDRGEDADKTSLADFHRAAALSSR